VALMKDQVEALIAKDVDTAFINSSLRRKEREARYAAIADGEYALLYVTHERFRKPEFLAVIAQRQIALLAVDEAHCVSEWGHDFRPDYTRLDEFRRLLDHPTTIALTATATPDVQRDIVRQLGLSQDEMPLFHQGIDRPNLKLEVERVWDDDEKLKQIVHAARHELSDGSGIVYFTLIKKLLAFSDQLTAQGVAHVCYHGDLERVRRRRIQEKFMRGEAPLVLATNAFGMGIDKRDIRFVLHADLPGSMESYYQEIGRAGRDGLPSRCLLLYDERDLATQMEFIEWSNPSAEFYDRVYGLLARQPEEIAAFGLDWIRDQIYAKSSKDFRLDTALSILDRWGVIDRDAGEGPFAVRSELPKNLSDEQWLEEKLQRDRRKLYALVEYVNHEGDRKEFIHRYFGLAE